MDVWISQVHFQPYNFGIKYKFHQNQAINVPTAGAQAFRMDYT
jgi:hypothetical protein